jgi:hypothetical protein
MTMLRTEYTLRRRAAACVTAFRRASSRMHDAAFFCDVGRPMIDTSQPAPVQPTTRIC